MEIAKPEKWIGDLNRIDQLTHIKLVENLYSLQYNYFWWEHKMDIFTKMNDRKLAIIGVNECTQCVFLLFFMIFKRFFFGSALTNSFSWNYVIFIGFDSIDPNDKGIFG